MIIYNGASSLLDPRVVSRMRFGHAAKFLAPLAPLIKIGLATRRKGKTAMGRAMSHVLSVAMNKEFPNLEIEPANVRLSEGSLPNPTHIGIEREGNLIKVSWEKTALGREVYADDEVIICAYDIPGKVAFRNTEPAERKDGCSNIELSDDKTDVSVHLYLMCHNRDKTKFSRSIYLGYL